MKISKYKTNLFYCGLIIAIAMVMYLFNIRCLVKEIFGIPCPACGITRAYVSLLHLDFKKAFEFNPMFWAAPFIFIVVLFGEKAIFRKRINTIFYIGLAIGFLITWIFKLI